MTRIKIPSFKTEAAEREFWRTHDSSDYIDWGEAKEAAFPKLRPSTRTISLRLPEAMLEDLRHLAKMRDVPYQSLIKIMLAERLDTERARRKHQAA